MLCPLALFQGLPWAGGEAPEADLVVDGWTLLCWVWDDCEKFLWRWTPSLFSSFLRAFISFPPFFLLSLLPFIRCLLPLSFLFYLAASICSLSRRKSVWTGDTQTISCLWASGQKISGPSMPRPAEKSRAAPAFLLILKFHICSCPLLSPRFLRPCRTFYSDYT